MLTVSLQGVDCCRCHRKCTAEEMQLPQKTFSSGGVASRCKQRKALFDVRKILRSHPHFFTHSSSFKKGDRKQDLRNLRQTSTVHTSFDFFWCEICIRFSSLKFSPLHRRTRLEGLPPPRPENFQGKCKLFKNKKYFNTAVNNFRQKNIGTLAHVFWMRVSFAKVQS